MSMDTIAVRESLRTASRIFWSGIAPPLARVDASDTIYDPSADYRLPNTAHQSYDMVYLVERDLGQVKAWPLVVDEALRLLAPNGLLILRMTNSRFCSIFELKHQLFQWGGLRAEFEYVCENGAVTFAVRNTAVSRRPVSVDSISIGVITDGRRNTQLYAFLDSVVAMRRRPHQRVETLVCGPEDIRDELQARYADVRLVADDGDFSEQGWITRKKNQLVAVATSENLVVAHDRYTLSPNFLESLDAFGGDFACVVCRQIRPDGSRFPDWVTLGSDWSWTSPAMLEYGDWSRHVYINGGIIVAKTAVMRATPWNDLLFWNQAEDVELTRRLRAGGHVPRLARHVEVTSQITRHGTMESFEALPARTDRYYIPGPVHAMAESVTPSIPYHTRATFGNRWGRNAAQLGVAYDEQWVETPEGITLEAGRVGAIAFRLSEKPVRETTLQLWFAAPVAGMVFTVNDVALEATACAPGAYRMAVPADRFALSNVFRLHVRQPLSSTETAVCIQQLSVEPSGWVLGEPLPVTADALLQLTERPSVARYVDGGSLVVTDLARLVRGARRIAILMPADLHALTDFASLLASLRDHVRADTEIRIVADFGVHALFDGFDCQVVQWSRVGAEPDYAHACAKELNDYMPDVIINAFPVRPLQVDLFVVECEAPGIVGFAACGYVVRPNTVDSVTPRYTCLLETHEQGNAAALQAILGLPDHAGALWPNRENRELAISVLAPLHVERKQLLGVLGASTNGPLTREERVLVQSYHEAGWKVVGVGDAAAQSSVQRVLQPLGDDAVNLCGALGPVAVFAVLQQCGAYVGGSNELHALAYVAGCTSAPEQPPAPHRTLTDAMYDALPILEGAL